MRALVLAAAVVVAGCASNDPCDNVFGACVALTVEGSGSVDTLRLGLSGAVQASRVAPPQQTLTPLPVYLALQLAHANTKSGAPFTGGDVRIDVEGTRAGASVGSASTHVMLGAGDHVKASVTLSAGPLPAGDDLAAAPDDLAQACTTSDLAVLASDPHNCGSCGHDCLGGDCASGRCQPMVVVAQANAYGIALDAANVYFSRTAGVNRGIARQPLTGGAPINIYNSSMTSILGMAVAGGKLIVNESYLHLESLPLPGGAASLTAGFDTPLTTFAVDSAHVYYATNADTVVRSIGVDLAAGSTPTVVGTIAQTATALASDGTTLYYATTNSLGALPLPSGATPVPFGSFGNISGLAVDGNTLWATTSAGTILTLQRSGSTVTIVDTISAQATPVTIAVDASAVYWVNQGDATVMRVAR
jgi:hypothetical protein